MNILVLFRLCIVSDLNNIRLPSHSFGLRVWVANAHCRIAGLLVQCVTLLQMNLNWELNWVPIEYIYGTLVKIRNKVVKKCNRDHDVFAHIWNRIFWWRERGSSKSAHLNIGSRRRSNLFRWFHYCPFNLFGLRTLEDVFEIEKRQKRKLYWNEWGTANSMPRIHK